MGTTKIQKVFHSLETTVFSGDQCTVYDACLGVNCGNSTGAYCYNGECRVRTVPAIPSTTTTEGWELLGNKGYGTVALQ